MKQMSLAEIKEAVEALSPADLAELAQFIRQRENLAWDRQIDGDFAEQGRLRPVIEEVRENLRSKGKIVFPPP
ncbi:MAG TPA: hypothetical protein VGA01_18750 [Candidatus Binatia bacterium]